MFIRPAGRAWSVPDHPLGPCPRGASVGKIGGIQSIASPELAVHTIAASSVLIGDHLIPSSTIFAMVVIAIFLWRVYDTNRTKK
jgi:hypothetical protein